LRTEAYKAFATAMSDGDRLMHSIRHGVTRGAGMLDDYAQMARAALALHEISGEQNYLDRAEAWVCALERHF
jgi:uncharacterized protein YyaL (SSP411 family)